MEEARTSSLTDRMVRAARLETAVYEEVEADTNATSQALVVVVLAALASGIGGLIAGMLSPDVAAPVGGLIGGMLSELLGWAAWSYVAYLVGTRLFHGTATYSEVLRALGFAQSPGVLLVFRFIPLVGGLVALAVGIWRIVAGFIGLRQALDLSNGNTLATIVVGVLAYIVAAIIIGVVLATLGMGFGLITGM